MLRYDKICESKIWLPESGRQTFFITPPFISHLQTAAQKVQLFEKNKKRFQNVAQLFHFRILFDWKSDKLSKIEKRKLQIFQKIEHFCWLENNLSERLLLNFSEYSISKKKICCILFDKKSTQFFRLINLQIFLNEYLLTDQTVKFKLKATGEKGQALFRYFENTLKGDFD